MNRIATAATASTAPITAKVSLNPMMSACCRTALPSATMADAVDSTDLASALETMLIDCAGLTLDEEVLGLHRLVIAESDRFPELAQTFYRKGVQRVPVAITEWLETQCRRGLLRLEDPKTAAGMLLGMMISEPQRAAILGQGKPLSAKAVRERAHTCARLFLRGCVL